MSLRTLLIGSFVLAVFCFAASFMLALSSGLKDADDLPMFLAKKYFDSPSLSTQISEETILPVAEITALIVSMNENDVKIMSVDRPDFLVRINGRIAKTNNQPLSPLVQTDILDNEMRLRLNEEALKSALILGDEGEGIHLNFNGVRWGEGVDVMIEVPKHLTRLEVDSVSGDIDLDVDIQRLRIRSYSGDVEILNRKADLEAEISTTAGDIDFKFLTAPDVQMSIQTHTGDIEVFENDLREKVFESKKGSGKGRLFIQTTTGDIDVE